MSSKRSRDLFCVDSSSTVFMKKGQTTSGPNPAGLVMICGINSAGKRDRLGLLFPSDNLLVTNRPKAVIIL